jgi:hypothetical protein
MVIPEPFTIEPSTIQRFSVRIEIPNGAPFQFVVDLQG